MNTTEAHAVLMMLGLSYDRQIPQGLPEIWAATLGDLPFELCKSAALELIRTSPYLPKVAEIRERARLIKAERERRDGKHRQLEGRTAERTIHTDTGARMCTHVLGRLADAGQDIAAGHFLGKDRATAIAEEAVREWLTTERTTA